MTERLKSHLCSSPTPLAKQIDGPVEQREIPRCISAIYNIIEQLEDTVVRLNAKTSSIQQVTPASVKETENTGAVSELGNQLSAIGQRILDIKNNLIEIIERIEL